MINQFFCMINQKIIGHTENFWGSGSYSKTVRPNGFLFTDGMMATNTMVSRLTQRGSDEDMGRTRAWQRFKCHEERHLTIFTAFQVSQKSAKGLGMEMAYMQQWWFPRAQNKATPVNPRAQFWIDLSVQITHFQDAGD